MRNLSEKLQANLKELGFTQSPISLGAFEKRNNETFTLVDFEVYNNLIIHYTLDQLTIPPHA